MKTGTMRKRPRPLTSIFKEVRAWCAYLLTISIVTYGFAPMIVSSQTVVVSGNIHPDFIEIDSSANHYPGVGTILNLGPTGGPAPTPTPRTFVDWVLDASANSDQASLSGGIATGLISGLTAATNGTGHWNGVRIVDRFAGADQDIFKSGGKVNEPESWKVGPGSVGSAKFDSTQMFLANNQDNLFFGMERRGNDGTTAFDFEFNQLAPRNDFVDDPSTNNFDESTMNGFVPVRSDGDVLISFQLNGSGGDSGSVNIFIFRFSGGLYAPFCDDDPTTSGTGQDACVGELISSISTLAGTTPEPWGYVKGSTGWVLTPDFERRIFAEAQVPLSFLPGVDNCGGTAFVAIRTRSSVSLTSDAKDTTKYFQYNFGGPKAVGALSSDCGLNIDFDAAGSENAAGGTTGLSYEWRFEKLVSGNWVDAFDLDPQVAPEDEAADATTASGTIVAPGPGTYRAVLKVIEATDCFIEDTTESVTVFNDVGGTVVLTSDCDDSFGYVITPSGGSGSYVYDIRVYRNDGDADKSGAGDSGDVLAKTILNTTTASGSLDTDDFTAGGTLPGDFYMIVTIKDANDPDCLFNATSNIISVREAVGGTASLIPDCDDTFGYSASGTGGSGNYTYDWTIYKENGAVDLVAKTFTDVGTSSGQLDIDDFNAGANGPGRYYGVVRIKDTNHSECYHDVTTNAIDVRYLLTATAVKTSATTNVNQADASFSVLATGSTNADASDPITITKQWQQYLLDGSTPDPLDRTWVNVGGDSATLTRTLADIISLGPTGSEQTLVDILSNPYSLRVSSLDLRFTASQTLNTIACPATSDPITVRAIKAIDP